MGRFAVFVDAGHLYAEGAKAVSGGAKVARSRIRLDQEAVVCSLRSFGNNVAPGSELLRVYWYDGMKSGKPTREQLALARTDNVKMRFGTLIESQEGFRQKGVDTLLVTDIIELARNRAISDAVVLSGDEDVRRGVRIAQSYGIRVHLLGISSKGGNQSNRLMQEADTCSEWQAGQLADFLTVDQSHSRRWVDVPATDAHDDDEKITLVVEEVSKTLRQQRLIEIAHLSDDDRVPEDIYSLLLGTCKATLGRWLNRTEKTAVRDEFKKAARRAVAAGQDSVTSP